MTHDELEAVRWRISRISPGVLRHAESWGSDLVAMLAYIDELHGIVHDMRQEPGWELGRQEERLHMLGLIDKEGEVARAGYVSSLTALARLGQAIRIRGPVAPHLTPDDLRRENEALRAALRGLVVASDRSVGAADALDYVFIPTTLVMLARRLLGDA